MELGQPIVCSSLAPQGRCAVSGPHVRLLLDDAALGRKVEIMVTRQRLMVVPGEIILLHDGPPP